MQYVTLMVGYMNARANTTPGHDKDAGWEVGVRQTVPVALPGVWKFLLGPGLPLWLGETALKTEKGARYETHDHVRGEVRQYTDNAKIRLTWQPSDWPHPTELYVSVKAVEAGTTIAIQHEQLADREERRMMLGHWKNVIAAIAHEIDKRAK